jgi:hypothetical protein
MNTTGTIIPNNTSVVLHNPVKLEACAASSLYNVNATRTPIIINAIVCTNPPINPLFTPFS